MVGNCEASKLEDIQNNLLWDLGLCYQDLGENLRNQGFALYWMLPGSGASLLFGSLNILYLEG